MQEIETAIQLWLETAKKHGKPIPLPKGSKIKDPKKRFNVIFPESLLKTVDEYRENKDLKNPNCWLVPQNDIWLMLTEFLSCII